MTNRIALRQLKVLENIDRIEKEKKMNKLELCNMCFEDSNLKPDDVIIIDEVECVEHNLIHNDIEPFETSKEYHKRIEKEGEYIKQ